MNYNSRPVDMLECDISGKIGRTFLHISWDPIDKQYALGVRVFTGRVGSLMATIYLDSATTSLLYQRLLEILSQLNKFNTHEIKPVQNYVAAFKLFQTALQPIDRLNWGVFDFDPIEL